MTKRQERALYGEEQHRGGCVNAEFDTEQRRHGRERDAIVETKLTD